MHAGPNRTAFGPAQGSTTPRGVLGLRWLLAAMMAGGGGAMLLLGQVLAATCTMALSMSPPSSAAAQIEVWYSPHFADPATKEAPPDLFPLLNAPSTAWPELAARSSTFKLKMQPLLGNNTRDADLAGLAAVIRSHGMRTGLEVGGARWIGNRCNASSQLQYARQEQKTVSRWLALGGSIDSITTDHALTWDIRHELRAPPCVPPVPMVARIEAVAQVFGSWRTFLGPHASLGFIESLGYWEITGPDGTNFTNTSPTTLNNISGWISRLDQVTDRLLAAAATHNPMPAVPLLDHYQIDYGMDGVEADTIRYGGGGSGGPINYARVLGAEGLMAARGLRTGVILNANAARTRTFAPAPGAGCLVGCDPEITPSHSAAVRTLNVTRGYMGLRGRLSDHALLEQWQAYPNRTGPETELDTGMWMASAAAAILKQHADTPGIGSIAGVLPKSKGSSSRSSGGGSSSSSSRRRRQAQATSSSISSSSSSSDSFEIRRSNNALKSDDDERVATLRTPSMQVDVAVDTGEITGIRTAHGFVCGRSSGCHAASWLGQHGSAGRLRHSTTAVNVTRCGPRLAAICVSRLVSVPLESESGAQSTALKGSARLVDILEASAGGSVKWTLQVTHRTNGGSSDIFRSIIGHSLRLYDAELPVVSAANDDAVQRRVAARAFWVPTNNPEATNGPPPAPSPPAGVPYPVPFLAPCVTGSGRHVPVEQQWDFGRKEKLAASLYSVGTGKCLLTWLPAFTRTNCHTAPGEVAVLYPCSSTTAYKSDTNACPNSANILWDFENGVLSNRVGGELYCLDSSKVPLMTPCNGTESDRGWLAKPVVTGDKGTGTVTQLESRSVRGHCLSTAVQTQQLGNGDPLRMRTTGRANLSYGDPHFLSSCDAKESVGRSIMPYPTVVFTQAGNGSGAGLAFVSAMNDSLLGVAVDASVSGLDIRRYNNQISVASTPSMAVYLVPTDSSDWRPGMKWVRDQFNAFFQPSVDPTLVSDYGQGMYTCAGVQDLNVSQLAKSGGNVLWDAHFFWPYQGLFLPPAQQSWSSNKGGGEQTDCGVGWSHGNAVNMTMIKTTYIAAKRVNINVLSYFNFMYFGQNPRWPLHSLPTEQPDEFYNSTLYLARHLNDSVCQPFRRDWQGSVGLDPGVDSWLEFLVKQIALKVAAFGPTFNGIVVDEPTKASVFSTARGDGASWCGCGESQPCASQLFAWINASRAIRAALDSDQPRVMLTNQVLVPPTL
jgi:hypothetical protein